MKHFVKISPILIIIFLLTSCTSVRVASDYDKNVNFDTFKTFAFYKTGIDKAEINDLDKIRKYIKSITEINDEDWSFFSSKLHKNSYPKKSIITHLENMVFTSALITKTLKFSC